MQIFAVMSTTAELALINMLVLMLISVTLIVSIHHYASQKPWSLQGVKLTDKLQLSNLVMLRGRANMAE